MRLKDKVGQNIMTNEQFFKNLLNEYSLVSVLSNKNDCKVYRVRNNTLKKDMVVRCDNSPLIYDVIALDEVQTLLKCAGYPTLYVKHPFDSIITYGICKKLSVVEINELLFNYDMETLG